LNLIPPNPGSLAEHKVDMRFSEVVGTGPCNKQLRQRKTDIESQWTVASLEGRGVGERSKRRGIPDMRGTTLKTRLLYNGASDVEQSRGSPGI